MPDEPVMQDGGPDDAYVEGEGEQEIDWNEVSRLDARYAEVLSIEDDEERMAAVKRLTAELAGE